MGIITYSKGAFASVCPSCDANMRTVHPSYITTYIQTHSSPSKDGRTVLIYASHGYAVDGIIVVLEVKRGREKVFSSAQCDKMGPKGMWGDTGGEGRGGVGLYNIQLTIYTHHPVLIYAQLSWLYKQVDIRSQEEQYQYPNGLSHASNTTTTTTTTHPVPSPHTIPTGRNLVQTHTRFSISRLNPRLQGDAFEFLFIVESLSSSAVTTAVWMSTLRCKHKGCMPSLQYQVQTDTYSSPSQVGYTALIFASHFNIVS